MRILAWAAAAALLVCLATAAAAAAEMPAPMFPERGVGAGAESPSNVIEIGSLARRSWQFDGPFV
jgi:hypothetical protein